VELANEIQFLILLANQQYHHLVKFARSGSGGGPKNPEDTTEVKHAQYQAVI
jgi:hypothetical protein